MEIPVKMLSDERLKYIHQLTKLYGSIPSTAGIELLGHIEAIKTEAAIKIWQAKEKTHG